MPERVNGAADGGAGQRLRRFQERFGPAATRVVVRCEYRYHPGIPRDKICIFNRAQVLHGLYDVSARMRIESPGFEYFDPNGCMTELNVWSREGTPAADAAVATWIKHFDDLGALAAVPRWRRSTAVQTGRRRSRRTAGAYLSHVVRPPLPPRNCHGPKSRATIPGRPVSWALPFRGPDDCRCEKAVPGAPPGARRRVV
ncbi:hypothetical protein ACIF80_09220 [Streptomyces sp. NPDC085927]|uniref:hypothetical protein n=1 Tax=Streptomyces sp. NPDC085927 TaxID=3365738 RepID=UPI0037D07F81